MNKKRRIIVELDTTVKDESCGACPLCSVSLYCRAFRVAMENGRDGNGYCYAVRPRQCLDAEREADAAMAAMKDVPQ